MSGKVEYVLPSGVRVTAKGYRQWRADQGLCSLCDEPLSMKSIRWCDRHLLSQTNSARGYRSATGLGRK